MERDVALAIMGSAMAAAGLLLVFAGFLFARADQYESRRGDKYRLIARLGLIPLVSSLVCTWFSLKAAENFLSWYSLHLALAFTALLIVTGVYAVAALLLAK
jgi:hypothetical protein